MVGEPPGLPRWSSPGKDRRGKPGGLPNRSICAGCHAHAKPWAWHAASPSDPGANWNQLPCIRMLGGCLCPGDPVQVRVYLLQQNPIARLHAGLLEEATDPAPPSEDMLAAVDVRVNQLAAPQHP